MTFAQDLARHRQHRQTVLKAIEENAIAEVKTSVVHGSPITGAPGQPETTGELERSWQETKEGDVTMIYTKHPGAPTIEAGTRRGRALVLHSRRGGFHSVALTVAGWSRIVAHATAAVGRG